MLIVRIIIALAIPFITALFFMFLAGKKYASIDEDLRFSAKSYEFPHDISDYSQFITTLFVRKMSLYYPLTIISCVLFFFFPKIGSIALSVSSFILLVLCFGHIRLLSRCKRAMRGLSAHNALLFSPLRSIYRMALVFSALLFTYFNLTLDYVLWGI